MQDTQYKKGLVIVHTGNGKGKTTAALGLAIRAWGEEAAKKALQEAKMEMISNKWDMIILDEINYAIDFNLVDLKDVLDLIAEKPADLHLVMTGRNAKEEIIQKANLVTEMKEIKHPYKEGIKAQKGIEF